ncbi:hypothetical protein LZC95_48760 [Pendulispora brunnea]|uniref:Lipoprotein n=1 Tax=Pendulispora brunnea TaxID=2905690 RepID=A0ABZ2KD71_9BACT
MKYILLLILLFLAACANSDVSAYHPTTLSSDARARTDACGKPLYFPWDFSLPPFRALWGIRTKSAIGAASLPRDPMFGSSDYPCLG